MTTKGEGSNFWRYTWDYENRLTQASTRKQSVRYKYDALGRRVQRVVGSGKENTKFIYDGLDVLADDNGGTLTKYLNGPGIDNKLRVQTGILATRYGFTGRERDDFTGLMYYRARTYDPNLGRFISEDPIGFGGGNGNGKILSLGEIRFSGIYACGGT